MRVRRAVRRLARFSARTPGTTFPMRSLPVWGPLPPEVPGPASGADGRFGRVSCIAAVRGCVDVNDQANPQNDLVPVDGGLTSPPVGMSGVVTARLLYSGCV